MGSFVSLFLCFILCLLLFVSATDPITIEPADGRACLGGFGSFVCRVNGTGLAWVRNGNVAFFRTTSNQLSQPLRNTIFTAYLLTSEDGDARSEIRTDSRVNRSLDGTLLACRNTFVSGPETVSTNITIDVTNSSAATFIGAAAFINASSTMNGINVTLEGATCVSVYDISVSRERQSLTTATRDNGTYLYTPPCPGRYEFIVYSIDYFGNIIGNLSTSYCWQMYQFSIQLRIDGNNTIITIESDTACIPQPPIISCNITVNNVTNPCNESTKTVVFSNMTMANYTYNVTIGNAAGKISRSGVLQDLIRTATVSQTVTQTVMVEELIGDPTIFATPFIVLGLLIILSIIWLVLRCCWKRLCCCPRVWRSHFWIIFFCYDCFTLNGTGTDESLLTEKGGNPLSQKNPSVGEKGVDTSL